jgi:hypothetical protein
MIRQLFSYITRPSGNTHQPALPTRLRIGYDKRIKWQTCKSELTCYECSTTKQPSAPAHTTTHGPPITCAAVCADRRNRLHPTDHPWLAVLRSCGPAAWPARPTATPPDRRRPAGATPTTRRPPATAAPRWPSADTALALVHAAHARRINGAPSAVWPIDQITFSAILSTLVK